MADVPQGSFPITVRLTDHNAAHTRLSIWVNHGLICSPGGICLRNEEVKPFLSRLNPDKTEYASEECREFLESLYGKEIQK